MAFVCSLLEDEDFAELFREGNSFMAKSVVGYDDVFPLMYYIAVFLDVVPGGLYELRCCVEVYNGETEDWQYLWSGAETSFISKDVRPRVLDCLLGLVQQIVSRASPKEMFMCTSDANIPKATRKHVLVAKICEELGYHVRVADQYEGQRVWHMEQTEQRSRCSSVPTAEEVAARQEE